MSDLAEPLNAFEFGRIVGRVDNKTQTNEDALALVNHIICLEELLDEGDNDDAFGTEGWRHRLGIDDA